MIYRRYKGGRESSRKPGSVLSHRQTSSDDETGSYLSGTFVTKRLKRFSNIGTGKRPTMVPATLHPLGVYRASTSRYCWCALTAPLHPYPETVVAYPRSSDKAVCFCGTLLTLTRTGRYPASLVFRVPGLSSNWLKR